MYTLLTKRSVRWNRFISIAVVVVPRLELLFDLEPVIVYIFINQEGWQRHLFDWIGTSIHLMINEQLLLTIVWTFLVCSVSESANNIQSKSMIQSTKPFIIIDLWIFVVVFVLYYVIHLAFILLLPV